MIVISTNGPDDWIHLIASPDRHWKAGHSAYALAHCWEDAKGFPKEIQKSLATIPALKGAKLLLAIPEYKVHIPGGGAASQNDLFCIARGRDGLIAMTVEGKVNEPFGPLVSDWYIDPSPGKVTRLDFLCLALGLDHDQVQGVRYQLLHRTASAIIEADRFGATKAMMMVHSFSQANTWFDDYAAFAALFGLDAKLGQAQFAGTMNGVNLFLAWVKGDARYLETLP